MIHYISTNEEQMRYDVFHEKDYDIGSGAVEGACKYIVGKRLKQSGMIWKRQGSSFYISLTDNLAEQKVGATLGKEAHGSLKNLATIVTCTQLHWNHTSQLSFSLYLQ